MTPRPLREAGLARQGLVGSAQGEARARPLSLKAAMETDPGAGQARFLRQTSLAKVPPIRLDPILEARRELSRITKLPKAGREGEETSEQKSVLVQGAAVVPLLPLNAPRRRAPAEQADPAKEPARQEKDALVKPAGAGLQWNIDENVARWAKYENTGIWQRAHD